MPRPEPLARALSSLGLESGINARFLNCGAPSDYQNRSFGLLLLARCCFVNRIPDVATARIQVADLVIIPVKPSPHDLRGVGATVELCQRAQRPFVFVLTQAIGRSGIVQQALLALSQHTGP